MLVPTSAPTRRAAAVGVATLALCLAGSPAHALGLDTLTDPVATTVDSVTGPVQQVLDPVTGLLIPVPTPTPTPAPAPAAPIVPDALAPVLGPVLGNLPVAAPAPAAPAPVPVSGQGTSPQPVTGPATGSTTTATDPVGTSAGTSSPGTAPATTRTTGGTGTAGSPRFDGFLSLPGLFGGTGRADGLSFGSPMIAGAPDYLMSLPAPQTAPFVEVQASSPRPAGTPAGLPALVVVVAAAAVGAAGAGQVAELRRRRAAAVSL